MAESKELGISIRLIKQYDPKQDLVVTNQDVWWFWWFQRHAFEELVMAKALPLFRESKLVH